MRVRMVFTSFRSQRQEDAYCSQSVSHSNGTARRQESYISKKNVQLQRRRDKEGERHIEVQQLYYVTIPVLESRNLSLSNSWGKEEWYLVFSCNTGNTPVCQGVTDSWTDSLQRALSLYLYQSCGKEAVAGGYDPNSSLVWILIPQISFILPPAQQSDYFVLFLF